MSLIHDLDTACTVRDAGEGDSVDGVPPRVVASPQDTTQTSALLRASHRMGLAVVATGHRTKLSWGRPPRRVDVLLETAGMNQLVEHAEGDLIATAGAGLALADLNAQLNRARQQLVLDDPVGDATVGGMLGAGLCGSRRLWAGGPRDLVLGITVVRADGTVAKSGGKVVKNVAGYDVGKLLTGSFGTLGVITQATFRLHPVAESSRWTHANIPADKLEPALVAIRSSQLVPQAVEIDAPAPELDAPSNGSGPRTADPALVRLAMLFTGTSAGTEGRAGAAAELLAELDVQSAATTTSDWVDTLPGDDTHGPLLKLTTKLSSVADLVSACREHGVRVRGSAGVGVLFGRIAGHEVSDVAARVRGLRSFCVSSGGSLVVLDGTPQMKAGVDVWGDDDISGLDLMRRVKQEFDPTGTLAPGRFVGGI